MLIYLLTFLLVLGILGLILFFTFWYVSLSHKEEDALFFSDKKQKDFLKKYEEYERRKR